MRLGTLALCLLLASPAAAAEQTGVALPSADEVATLCETILHSDGGEQEIRLLPMNSKRIDINNDGIEEEMFAGCGGSANVCDPAIKSGDEITWYGSDGDRLGGGYGFSWLSFRGKNYTLYYQDDGEKYPMTLTYVAPNNLEYEVCGFRTDAYTNLHAVPERRQNEEICRRIAVNDVIPIPETPVALNELSVIDRFSTNSVSKLELDYNQDGQVDKLWQMSVSHAGGRTCSFNYYVLGNDDGAAEFSSPAAAALNKLQSLRTEGGNLPPSHAQSTTCGGNSLRWLVLSQDQRLKGPLYLEFRGYPNINPRF